MNTGKFTKTYNVQPNEQQKDVMNTSLKSNVTGLLLSGWDVEVITDSGEFLNLNNGSLSVTITRTKGCKVFSECFVIGPKGGMKHLG